MILKVILVSWLIWCAIAWAYTFATILTQGSITSIEPNTGILITELTIACLLSIGGIIYLERILRRRK